MDDSGANGERYTLKTSVASSQRVYACEPKHEHVAASSPPLYIHTHTHSNAVTNELEAHADSHTHTHTHTHTQREMFGLQ